MLEPGQVVLAHIQFADSFETKKRPAVLLFEEFTNVIVAGVTSNTERNGIFLAKKEGAVKDSVSKTNYLFTLTEKAIVKKLFKLSPEKKNLLYAELEKKLRQLKA